ncbi:MAG: phage holin family protein [Verrucomicrobiota bacterium]
MNASSRMDSSTPPPACAAPAAAPGTWSEALGNLIHARLCLLQLELGGAARQIGKSVLLLGSAALAVIFAWALGLAGGIAALAAATAWSWHWIALAAALVHLLAAATCLQLAKASSPPTFPVTRAEFQKDCEWLNTLKSPRKSND